MSLVIVWGFTVVKLLSDALLTISNAYRHLHCTLPCPLVWTLCFLFRRLCPSWSCGAAEFRHVWSACLGLGILAHPATCRHGWNSIVKDEEYTYFLGAFRRGRRGQNEAIWKYGAVNSAMSEYWPMFCPSLVDCFKVWFLHTRCPVWSCECSCQVTGCVPFVASHEAVVSVAAHHFSFLSTLLVSSCCLPSPCPGIIPSK